MWNRTQFSWRRPSNTQKVSSNDCVIWTQCRCYSTAWSMSGKTVRSKVRCCNAPPCSISLTPATFILPYDSDVLLPYAQNQNVVAPFKTGTCCENSKASKCYESGKIKRSRGAGINTNNAQHYSCRFVILRTDRECSGNANYLIDHNDYNLHNRLYIYN